MMVPMQVDFQVLTGMRSITSRWLGKVSSHFFREGTKAEPEWEAEIDPRIDL